MESKPSGVDVEWNGILTTITVRCDIRMRVEEDEEAGAAGLQRSARLSTLSAR
jgi:hypothetical protein